MITWDPETGDPEHEPVAMGLGLDRRTGQVMLVDLRPIVGTDLHACDLDELNLALVQRAQRRRARSLRSIRTA